MSHYEAGRAAARLLWEEGLEDRLDFVDPLTPEFAEGALAELEHLQQSTALVFKSLRASNERRAVERGVLPRGHGGHSERGMTLGRAKSRLPFEGRVFTFLRFTHDGERVQLPHVIAMSLAFLSTKRNDPRVKRADLGSG